MLHALTRVHAINQYQYALYPGCCHIANRVSRFTKYSSVCLQRPLWWEATFCFKATLSEHFVVVCNKSYLGCKATCLLWPLSQCKRGGLSTIWLNIWDTLSLPLLWNTNECTLLQRDLQLGFIVFCCHQMLPVLFGWKYSTFTEIYSKTISWNKPYNGKPGWFLAKIK